ncbi:MAG: hypothetical protein WBZ31_07890 [Thiobacillus sp.]
MTEKQSNLFTESLAKLPRTADGWARLCEILKAALKDDVLKTSPPALEFAELMFEQASDAFFVKNSEQALEPLIQIVDSSRAAKKAEASHEGRRLTREYAEGLFMSHLGKWKSLSEAAASIRDAVLVESRRHPRPLAPGNAQKTINEWLSALVQNEPAAMERLTEQAKERIAKARNTTR